MKKYTPEEIQFIRDNISGRSYAEMTELFNRHFGCSVTLKQMNCILYYYNIRNYYHSDYNRFKPGHKPFRIYRPPIGTERMNNNGYIVVKVDDTKNNWKFKHRVIWEKAYGEIPKDHKIIVTVHGYQA